MPALQNNSMTRISETLDYYAELELRTEAEDPKESSQAKWGAAICEAVNAWYSTVYTVKDMSALKRYSLNSLLAAACDNDRLHEGDEEVPPYRSGFLRYVYCLVERVWSRTCLWCWRNIALTSRLIKRTIPGKIGSGLAEVPVQD
jgi:hypothetical protein